MKKTQLNRAVLERLKNLKWEEKTILAKQLGLDSPQALGNALRRESRQLITLDWAKVIMSYLGLKSITEYIENELITQPFEIE